MFKVIIADIEPIERKALKMVLEETYFHDVIVYETDSGKELLELINNTNPDFIIMDLCLIGMDGLTCLKILKECKLGEKIIINTMNIDKEIKTVLETLGISRFFIKPVRRRELIKAIKSDFSEIKPDKQGGTTPKVHKIISFIDQHLHEDLTLTYVSDKMKMSSYYLSKLFKKEMRVNFVTYVTEQKVQKAKQLLRDEQIPINVIAHELGYLEQSYFTKVFKRVEKITPTQYRKELLKKQLLKQDVN